MPRIGVIPTFSVTELHVDWHAVEDRFDFTGAISETPSPDRRRRVRIFYSTDPDGKFELTDDYLLSDVLITSGQTQFSGAIFLNKLREQGIASGTPLRFRAYPASFESAARYYNPYARQSIFTGLFEAGSKEITVTVP